jgi:hypothetical protein
MHQWYRAQPSVGQHHGIRCKNDRVASGIRIFFSLDSISFARRMVSAEYKLSLRPYASLAEIVAL